MACASVWNHSRFLSLILWGRGGNKVHGQWNAPWDVSGRQNLVQDVSFPRIEP